MDKAYAFFKKYPVTLIVFISYGVCWLSLLNQATIPPIVIGEWPLAPVIALPFCVIMILNDLFRKGHRLFYITISIIILIPFFIISLMQS
jgi:hypothetical protein